MRTGKAFRIVSFLVLVVLLLTDLHAAFAQGAPPPGDPQLVSSPASVEQAAIKAQMNLQPMAYLPSVAGSRPRNTPQRCSAQSAQSRVTIAASLLGMRPEDIDENHVLDLLTARADQIGVAVFQADGEGKLQMVAGKLPEVIASDARTPSRSALPTRAITSTITASASYARTIPSMAATGLRPGQTIMGPQAPDAPPAMDVATRIFLAYEYGQSLYKEDDQYGYVAEYPGYPLQVVNRSRQGDNTYPRQLGNYWLSHSLALGKITRAVIGSDFNLMDVTFADHSWNYGAPEVWADRLYGPDGQVEYITHIVSNRETEEIDLYLGTLILEENIQWRSHPTCYSISGFGLRFPSHRYMTRTNGTSAWRIMNIFNERDKALKIGSMLRDFGYEYDYYDPFWSAAGFVAGDNWMFTAQPYHDCDLLSGGTDSTEPHNFRAGYKYESKVCINRDAWILASREDWIATGLQAIWNLNKYNDPFRRFADPRDPLGILTTSPIEVAQWYEDAYLKNGSGVPYFLKDSAFGSRLRTDIMLVLESILAYKFGDTVSQAYADDIATKSMELMWGESPNPAHMATTLPWGSIVRGDQDKAPFLVWRWDDAFGWVFQRPDPSIVQAALDILNMPAEDESIGPVSVGETTWTYIQALRVYLWFKYAGTVLDSDTMLMPRDDVYLWGDALNSLAIPYETSWRAQDLLDAIVAQGGNPAYILKRYDGHMTVCYKNGDCPDNFQLEPGIGYSVWIMGSGLFFRTDGVPVGPGVTINITANADNLVSIPPAVSGTKSAYWAIDLYDLLQRSGCSGVLLARKSPNDPGDVWEIYDGSIPWPILPDRAYLVRSGSNCTIQP